jgi:hypothetical protein
MGIGWWWINARGPTTTRQRMQALYRSMRSALARSGLGALPSLTPDEFLTAHTRALAAQPRLSAALHQATHLYLEATFSPHGPTEAEIESAHRLWGRAASERMRLWIRALSRRPATRARSG